jgi:hypothetical protein
MNNNALLNPINECSNTVVVVDAVNVTDWSTLFVFPAIARTTERAIWMRWYRSFARSGGGIG